MNWPIYIFVISLGLLWWAVMVQRRARAEEDIAAYIFLALPITVLAACAIITLGIILTGTNIIKNAHAQPTKSLIFLVDVSSSVQPAEYQLQKRAYVSLLRDPEVRQHLAGAEIAIMEYCGGVAEFMVGFTMDLEAAAVAYQRASRLNTSCSTSPQHALWVASVALAERPGERIVDISGDEPPNCCSHLMPFDWADGKLKAYLDERRVTANGLIFGNDVERERAKSYYRRWLINGFMVEVSDREGFAAALKRKIVLEIS